MSMKTICNECIHNEVCVWKPVVDQIKEDHNIPNEVLHLECSKRRTEQTTNDIQK